MPEVMASAFRDVGRLDLPCRWSEGVEIGLQTPTSGRIASATTARRPPHKAFASRLAEMVIESLYLVMQTSTGSREDMSGAEMITSPAGEVTPRTSPIVVVRHHFAGAVVDHEESFALVWQAPEIDAVGWAEPFGTVDEDRGLVVADG
jgi:hypothetical protein